MNKQEDNDVVMEDELEYESDVEADLEVDELDSSGSDQENPAQPSISTSKKVTSGKPGTRVSGHTILPQVRIDNILQADGITGSLALSKEGQFILSVATEEFIKRLAQAGLQKARATRQQNMVNYVDMETIPQPLALASAWELRIMRHMELMEEDPALGGVIPPGTFGQAPIPPTPEPTFVASTSKRKKNGVVENGHSSAAAASSSRQSNANPEIASISTTSHAAKSSSSRGGGGSKKNGSSASVAGASALIVNGHGHASSTALSTPSEEKEDAMDVEDETGNETDEMAGDEQAWSTQEFTTGPASGFLQGPGAAPFGRVDDAQGRTIYTQKHQPD